MIETKTGMVTKDIRYSSLVIPLYWRTPLQTKSSVGFGETSVGMKLLTHQKLSNDGSELGVVQR